MKPSRRRLRRHKIEHGQGGKTATLEYCPKCDTPSPMKVSYHTRVCIQCGHRFNITIENSVLSNKED